MKKEKSESRSLRKKLLTAMIACVLTIVLISTFIFDLIYRQTVENVNTHFSEFSDKTVSVLSDSLYERNMANMKTVLHCFGSESGVELRNDYDSGATWDHSYYFKSKAMMYFKDAMFTNCIFFVISDVGIRNTDITTTLNADDKLKEAFDEITRSGNYLPKYNNRQSFEDYLNEHCNEPGGTYTREGEGFIVVWDDMSAYAIGERCVGLVMYDSNNWVRSVNKVAENETASLTSNMDALFRKYIHVLIVSVAGVFVIFAAVSVFISKKISDPVISEHDMLVSVNEMKTTFLSDASHELKTPLAAMSGYAQNAEIELLGDGNKENVCEMLKRISSEANRMALMVTQILDATRIEEGRMILEMSSCDIENLVREIMEKYFSVLNKNNNRLALRIPLELPPANADSTRLQRVFVNLISNALKHTQNGTILIKAEEDNGFIRITVKDNGCGISEEDMPHIWERYYKGKHSETGTGLGLFICRFIIESHGGNIWAESEPGNGASFIFTLPVYNPENE